MRFNTKVHVRWDDLDAFNHVNNAKYLTFVQEARVDMFWTDRKKRGLGPIFDDMVVARAEVDFISPIHDSGTMLDVEIYLEKIGNSSFVMVYEMSQSGTLRAKGKTVQVGVDMEDQKSCPLRDYEREYLEKYLET